MAERVNQAIADALTERQLQVGRVESHLRLEAWAVLAVLEREIVSALKAHDPTEFVLLSRRRQEVAQLMREDIDPLITLRYERLATMMDAALMRLAQHEAATVQQVVNAATEEETITDMPSTRQLRAGVVFGLFPSASTPTDFSTTGSDWWARQGASLSQRIGDSLTSGVALEESLTQLTQRVRGTSDNGFQDGLMAKARNDATRLVTTHLANTITEARAAVAARHPERMVLHHVSLRDGRTSLICIARDGKRFTADTHEPIGHTLPYLQGIPYHPS